jgi:hypothetical protein
MSAATGRTGALGGDRLETCFPVFVARHTAYVVLLGLTRTGFGHWCASERLDPNISIMRRPVWWRDRARRNVRELEEALARVCQ